jgi:hypothetical protein
MAMAAKITISSIKKNVEKIARDYAKKGELYTVTPMDYARAMGIEDVKVPVTAVERKELAEKIDKKLNEVRDGELKGVENKSKISDIQGAAHTLSVEISAASFDLFSKEIFAQKKDHVAAVKPSEPQKIGFFKRLFNGLKNLFTKSIDDNISVASEEVKPKKSVGFNINVEVAQIVEKGVEARPSETLSNKGPTLEGNTKRLRPDIKAYTAEDPVDRKIYGKHTAKILAAASVGRGATTHDKALN